MTITAVEFRKKWQKENPNTVHIPSEHEIRLMEKYARYYALGELANHIKTSNERGGLIALVKGWKPYWMARVGVTVENYIDEYLSN